jgi:membrane-bound lytic murein transglycosylase B
MHSHTLSYAVIMSGIEVVALVASIVSAIAGAASYLKEHGKRKAEKSKGRREQMRWDHCKLPSKQHLRRYNANTTIALRGSAPDWLK